MFCSNCSKLSYMHTKKNCIKCQAVVFNNISTICERCSSSDLVCSVCLKKISNNNFVANKNIGFGCKSCGG